jgi:hypothetical protein
MDLAEGDYVRVYDGTNTDYLRGSYTGNQIPDALYTSGERVRNSPSLLIKILFTVLGNIKATCGRQLFTSYSICV